MTPKGASAPSILAGAGWLVVTAAVTLTPHAWDARPSGLVDSWCILCADLGTANALLNVALFTPLGVVAGTVGLGLKRALLLGATASIAIEVLQAAIPGRYSTPEDILWNSAGAVAGVLLYRAVRFRLSKETAPAVGRTLAVVAGLAFVLGGWMLEPHRTDRGYWIQWTPELGHLTAYRGTLLQAELNSAPLPPGLIPAERRPDLSLSGDWHISATVTKSAARPGVAPIWSVYDTSQREIALLGAQDEDLVWRERTRARSLRFDQPDLRLTGALATHAIGDTLELMADARGHDRCLSVEGDRRCGLGFSPGRTWSFLRYPAGLPATALRVLDAIWLFAIMLPVSFFSTSRVDARTNGAIALGLLLLATATTRLTGPPLTELLAALLGLVGGWRVVMSVDDSHATG